MGDEAFDEVVIAARRGTLFIRGGYGREGLWLGLAKDQCPDGDPDIVVELTPLMRQRLIEALTEMPTPPSELCWFCEAVLWYPTNSKGHIPVEADVTCEVCGGVMRTVEDEDDERGPTIAMAPVRCGHGIAHDEGCARCAAPENTGRNQRT